MKIGSAYIAIHLAPEQLEQSVAFYERVFEQRCGLRFVWPEHEVEIAAVGPVVMIAGSAAALARSVSQTAALSVESLVDCHQSLVDDGVLIVQQPGDTPTGRNLFARHPDGAIFEYIQFDPAKAAAVNQALANSRMRVGIVGAGMIGGTVARLLAATGHSVALSSASGPQALRTLASSLGPQVQAASVEDAMTAGDVVLLAIPYGRFAELPADGLSGKIVIDAMNYNPARDGRIDFDGQTSTELLARHLSGARVVKALNTMSFDALGADGNPSAPVENRLALFVAGDDPSAKATVAHMIEELGFAAIDTGSLADSRRQEPGSDVFGQVMRPAEARRLLGLT